MPNRKLLDDYETLGYSKDEWLSFSKGKRWQLRHPERGKRATKSWASRNKEYLAKRARGYQLASKYNLTPEDYAELLRAQNGKCAICKTDTPTGKWKVFAVDHCHKTDEVRGLLCNECNRGMGLLKDSAELLRAAADYLDSHSIKTAQERAESKKNKEIVDDSKHSDPKPKPKRTTRSNRNGSRKSR